MSLAPAGLLARRTMPKDTLQRAPPIPPPPKILSQTEQDAAADEVGLGFNPALHTFGAFGAATLLVFLAATGAVYSVQQMTGATNVRGLPL